MEDEDSHEAQGPSRIVVADDHPLFRSAIRDTLERHPDLEVIAEAADGSQALEICRRFRPDLVLMDLGMPGMDGVAATYAIKKELPDTLVLILSAIGESADLADSLKAGAAGYVLKDSSAERITDAVRRALAGHSAVDEDLAMELLANLMGGEAKEKQREQTGTFTSSYVPERPLGEREGSRPVGPLTSREVEVMRLVVQGQTNQQIARTLAISVSTAKRHIRHISAKLGVCDRVQAAVRAVELGVLDERSEG